MIRSFFVEHKFRLCCSLASFIHKTGRKLLVTKFGCTSASNRQLVVCNTFSNIPTDSCFQFTVFPPVNMNVWWFVYSFRLSLTFFLVFVFSACMSLFVILLLWYICGLSLLWDSHTDPSFSLIDSVTVSNSLEPISMYLFRHRRRGDLDITVQGSSWNVLVHIMVASPFHKPCRACWSAFFLCFFPFYD